MKVHGQEPVSFDDVKNEIFDMVKPEDPLRLTLQDLLRWWVSYIALININTYVIIVYQTT